LNATVSGASPLVGLAVATATGGWFAAKYWIRLASCVSARCYTLV
jgi:carbon starvation protein CstA